MQYTTTKQWCFSLISFFKYTLQNHTYFKIEYSESFIKFLKNLKIREIFCKNPRIIFVLFYDVHKENMFTTNLDFLRLKLFNSIGSWIVLKKYCLKVTSLFSFFFRVKRICVRACCQFWGFISLNFAPPRPMLCNSFGMR